MPSPWWNHRKEKCLAQQWTSRVIKCILCFPWARPVKDINVCSIESLLLKSSQSIWKKMTCSKSSGQSILSNVYVYVKICEICAMEWCRRQQHEGRHINISKKQRLQEWDRFLPVSRCEEASQGELKSGGCLRKANVTRSGYKDYNAQLDTVLACFFRRPMGIDWPVFMF